MGSRSTDLRLMEVRAVSLVKNPGVRLRCPEQHCSSPPRPTPAPHLLLDGPSLPLPQHDERDRTCSGDKGLV